LQSLSSIGSGRAFASLRDVSGAHGIESGQISVFVRDPDRNVIELRGREQGVVEGVSRYVP
jgi:hypothetical protein